MKIGLIGGEGYVVNIMEWADDLPVPETWGDFETFSGFCEIGGQVIDGVYVPEPPEPGPAPSLDEPESIFSDHMIFETLEN